MSIVVIGGSNRIISKEYFQTADFISSKTLIKEDQNCYEKISFASSVIFTSYCTDLTGQINYDESVKTAKLVARLVPDRSRLLFLSSDHVFSGKRGNYLVDEEIDPTTEYGKVKAAQEKVFEGGVILRFTILGPSFSDRPLITEMIMQDKTIISYPNAHFSPVSSWAVCDIIDQHTQGALSPGIYHLATERTSKQYVFDEFAKKMGIKIKTVEDSNLMSDHSLVASKGFERNLGDELNRALNRSAIVN